MSPHSSISPDSSLHEISPNSGDLGASNVASAAFGCPLLKDVAGKSLLEMIEFLTNLHPVSGRLEAQRRDTALMQDSGHYGHDHLDSGLLHQLKQKLQRPYVEQVAESLGIDFGTLNLSLQAKILRLAAQEDGAHKGLTIGNTALIEEIFAIIPFLEDESFFGEGIRITQIDRGPASLDFIASVEVTRGDNIQHFDVGIDPFRLPDSGEICTDYINDAYNKHVDNRKGANFIGGKSDVQIPVIGVLDTTRYRRDPERVNTLLRDIYAVRVAKRRSPAPASWVAGLGNLVVVSQNSSEGNGGPWVQDTCVALDGTMHSLRFDRADFRDQIYAGIDESQMEPENLNEFLFGTIEDWA